MRRASMTMPVLRHVSFERVITAGAENAAPGIFACRLAYWHNMPRALDAGKTTRAECRFDLAFMRGDD